MDPKVVVSSADVQQAVDVANQSQNPGGTHSQTGSQTQGSGAASGTPTSTSTSNTASAPPAQPTKRELRILTLAEADLVDWCTAAGIPTQAFSFVLKDNAASTEWTTTGTNFRAKFDLNGLTLTVAMETRLGWQVVKDQNQIVAANKAETDLVQSLTDSVVKWFVLVGITNPPSIEIDLSTKTVTWQYRGYKFSAVQDGKKLKVKLVVVIFNRDAIEVNVSAKDEYDKVIASPPRLTPDEIATLQSGIAVEAFKAWLGGSPGSHWNLAVEADQTIIQTETPDRMIVWIYTPSSSTLKVMAEVPLGTTGAVELRGKHYVTVGSPADIDLLPKP